MEQITFEFMQRPTIKGFPELRWTGKRPYRSTQYYPAQLRESYGQERDGWINKLFWGDNLQVMSHMLKEFRGKIDFIYIDPPFDSKADYKRKVEIKNLGATETDVSSFEEKQYSDIWTNDEYLQFMYERLILMRELLSDKGTLALHCDWHKSHHLRMLLDETFGSDHFVNEIAWCYTSGGVGRGSFGRKHDSIFVYAKTSDYVFNEQYYKRYVLIQNGVEVGFDPRIQYYTDENGRHYRLNLAVDWWSDIGIVSPNSHTEKTGYPTQKPEPLLERLIKAFSAPNGIIFDCFMGSGTTQAVAMKLGRRFIGADINLGAVQTSTKRLLSIAAELDGEQPTLIQDEKDEGTKYTGFEVYNVNNYDFFRNPVEARELLTSALEIQPFPASDVWDGELDGRMVKIMPVNRIATKADLKELIANLPYKTYEKRKDENPSQPVERITIVCMGHEPDLKGALEQELVDYKIDIQIVDILRDKADLQLKRDAEAEIVRDGSKLVIKAFYPMNLMQKLSLQKEYVEDWRQLVDSIMIDWNYDGVVMQPAVTDVPGKDELVAGVYDIPESCGTIKVKITDLLSESLEVEVR